MCHVHVIEIYNKFLFIFFRKTVHTYYLYDTNIGYIIMSVYVEIYKEKSILLNSCLITHISNFNAYHKVLFLQRGTSTFFQ